MWLPEHYPQFSFLEAYGHKSLNTNPIKTMTFHRINCSIELQHVGNSPQTQLMSMEEEKEREGEEGREITRGST